MKAKTNVLLSGMRPSLWGLGADYLFEMNPVSRNTVGKSRLPPPFRTPQLRRFF
jgi:hypothetical protein